MTWAMAFGLLWCVGAVAPTFIIIEHAMEEQLSPRRFAVACVVALVAWPLAVIAALILALYEEWMGDPREGEG
jgi:branched-subunit amino acid ABC-type transport system permease component